MRILISLFNKTISFKVLHVLVLLLCIGAIIRFFKLEYSGLWLDEIYSMTGSDPNATWADVYEYGKMDQPPLFFILLHGWLKLFGHTDFAGRALTCTYGLLGIVAMYFLGKEVKDEKLGLFASFITTINWFHTSISREIRFYPLVFLLAALSYLFYLRSIKKSGTTNFILYTVFTALLLNTHYYGMAVFVTQVVIFILVLILFKRDSRLIVGGLISGGVAGMSFWHWLPTITTELNVSSFHAKPVGFDFPFNFAWDYIKDPVAFVVYAFCFFLVVRAAYTKAKEKRLETEHLVIFGWILLSFLIPLSYSLIKVPMLTSKYCTIAVPAIFLVIAYGFTFFKSNRITFFTIALITVSGFVLLFIARPPHKPRRGEDWREVAAHFANRGSDKEVTISQLAWFHQYYFRKNSIDPPIDQNKFDSAKRINDYDRFWLLTNSRYDGTNEFLWEQQQIIDREFNLSDSVIFPQTKAFLYARK